MSIGLMYPLCGCWYSDSEESHELGIFFEGGEECGNIIDGRRPYLPPAQPDEPCPGRLVRGTREAHAKWKFHFPLYFKMKRIWSHVPNDPDIDGFGGSNSHEHP